MAFISGSLTLGAAALSGISTFESPECVLKTFRVIGESVLLADFQSKPTLFVVNVVACDVETALAKLRSGGFVKTVTSVHVFNQPLLASEPLLDASKGPYEMIDVTPTLDDCGEICDFLVDEDLSSVAGVVCRAMVHFPHVVTGELNINSGTTFQSANYYHAAVGSMLLGGLSSAIDLGTIEFTSGVAATAFEAGVTFSTTPVMQVVPTLATVEIPCCSTPVLSVLNLTHNLSRLKSLSRFLLRNGFSMPETTPMYYRPRQGVWQSNVHFSGLSAETSGNETWDFSFEFGCAEDQVGAWRFTMMINVKNSAQDYMVRLLSFFSQNVVCRASASFDGFDFGFNFKKMTTEPVALGGSIFYDEIGIFAMSPSFNESPVLLFAMVAGGSARAQTSDHSLERQHDGAINVN